MLTKKLGFVLLSLLVFNTIQAQTYRLSGRIIENADTSSTLPGVGITLSTEADSSAKSGTLTDIDGYFNIENLQPGKYTLQATYVGYTTLTRTFNIVAEDVSLGDINMAASTTTLKSVTVEAKQIRAQQLGDTSQFNANAYKTNPDANAEDLVTKMPGVTNDNGTLKVNGEEVKQILVDGKPFFGDDPSTAVKNLPAEVIDKIQVFDKLSDQSQFTGFDDGQGQKTINIVTKSGKNNGQFGKIYAGYGTDDRYIVGGNLNYFKGDTRLSLIGLSNNINQQNFASDDLLGVVGTSSGQNRGGGGSAGSSGRGGGGPRGGGGGSDASNFMVGQQSGIATTNAIGLNYSDNWGKKIKVTGSYFFNSTDNNNNTTLSRRYVSTDQLYDETSYARARNQNHRANLRLEYNIDSSNSIVFTPRISLQDNKTNTTLDGVNTLPGEIINSRTNNRTSSNNTGYNLGGNLLYQHKFRKRGRTVSLNINSQMNSRDGGGTNYSFNQFAASGNTLLDQEYDLTSKGYTISPSLNYTEPIGKKGQLQANYSPSYSKNTSDKETDNLDPASGLYTDFDTLLSNKYENTYTTQKGGLNYRFNDKKMSFMLGANAQYSVLDGQQTFPRSFTLERNFTNLLPQAMYNYRFSNGKNLRVMYRTNTSAPTISQLQNVLDNSNPLLLKTGNADLKQNYQHTLTLRYGATNSQKATNFFVFAYANYTNNYVGNATYIPTVDSQIVEGIVVKQGSQLSRPVNLDGYFNGRTFATYGFPIEAIKSNLNLNGGISYSRTPAMINDQLNLSNSYVANGGFTLGSNISENVDFALSYTGNYNIVKNTLQKQSDNTYYFQTTSLKFNWIFLKGFVFNTNLNHTLYTGLSQDFNQSFLLWNASFGYKFFKNRALEAKITVFDLLDQNRSINRTVNEVYTEDSRTNLLQRYFMLNLTYTLRSFKQAGTKNTTAPREEMEPRPFMPQHGGDRGNFDR